MFLVGVEYMEFCPLCRNHCPLDNPNCPDVMNKEFREYLAEKKEYAKEHCTICDKQCSYTNLQCESGKLIAQIKGIIPRD